MDDTTRNLLLKARKGATAQFETKQWKTVLEALGFTVTLGKQRTTVVSFLATRGEHSFEITKEPQYRRIVFYKMGVNLKAVGCDLVAETCKLLGMDTPDAEKHKKAIAAGADDLHRTGTCQCCFNPQKVSKGGGKLMSLHGYQRPGIGYIIGDCMGQGEQPYEVSCELTKKLRGVVMGMKQEADAYLAKLKADEVEELPASIPTNEKENDRYGYPRTKYVNVMVKRGAPAAQNPHFPQSPWQRIPSFESLREDEGFAVHRKVQQMEAHIAFLSEKINTWTKVWES